MISTLTQRLLTLAAGLALTALPALAADVDGHSPTEGAEGTEITITGEGFLPSGKGKPKVWLTQEGTKKKVVLKVLSASDTEIVALLKKGKANKAIAQVQQAADGLRKIEATYSAPSQTHTALEPHCCVAVWNGERLTVHTSTQTVFLLGKEIARHYRLPKENVVVHSEYIGRAFGAKQGMRSEHTAASAGVIDGVVIPDGRLDG